MLTADEIFEIHKYYCDHFMEVLEAFQKAYEDCLEAGESFSDSVKEGRVTLNECIKIQDKQDFLDRLMLERMKQQN